MSVMLGERERGRRKSAVRKIPNDECRDEMKKSLKLLSIAESVS